MISDLYFSYYILEALCYCYKYIKHRSDYMLGRADKKHILKEGDAGLCLEIFIGCTLLILLGRDQQWNKERPEVECHITCLIQINFQLLKDILSFSQVKRVLSYSSLVSSKSTSIALVTNGEAYNVDSMMENEQRQK